MTDYELYKEWTAYLMKDYYASDFKLKPLILPTFAEWLIEVQSEKRNKKINNILYGK